MAEKLQFPLQYAQNAIVRTASLENVLSMLSTECAYPEREKDVAQLVQLARRSAGSGIDRHAPVTLCVYRTVAFDRANWSTEFWADYGVHITPCENETAAEDELSRNGS